MGTTIKVKIDPEFASLCPPLAEDELKLLEASLKTNGCQQPLILWKGQDTLLDGHNRHALCKKNKLDFKTTEVDLPDRDAALTFILHHQLGRRNLTPEAASYLRGKRYLELKHQGIQDTPAAGQSGQKQTTAQVLGDEYHVGERTIRRDAKLTLAVDKVVEECGHEYRQVILSRQYGLTRGSVMALAKLKPAEQKKYLDELKTTGKRPRKDKKKQTDRQVLNGLVEQIVDQNREKALSVLREAAKRLGMTLVEDKEKAK